MMWFVLAVALFVAPSARAQTGGASISGHVTGPSQSAIANATVFLKNTATGQTTQGVTDLSGSFAFPNLAPGSYEISVSASGFQTRTDTLTLAAGPSQPIEIALTPRASQLSLEDLGLSEAEAKGNARVQALLDKRSHMLQIHQRLGLITTAPMLATVLTSFGAKTGRMPTSSSTGRDIHAALGAVTTGLYAGTAYFAIRAPKVAGTQAHGHTRLHRALAWVHGPGMVLTPTLGAMAYSQASNGQRVHGIASLHSQVAVVTFGAFTAAMLSVSIR
jgi:hypothetical protein